jgi:hypothetical protein
VSRDRLSPLPAEIILKIFQFLDPISLRAVSLVCRRLRQLCQSLVYRRGMVSLVWQRQRQTGQRRARSSWNVVGFRWEFSAAMTPIRTWCRINEGGIQRHLAEECFFNQRAEPSRLEPNCQLMGQLERRVQLKKQSTWFIL